MKQQNSFEWNANGNALIVKSVGVFKINTDNSIIETDISKFTLRMKDSQINLDGKLTIFEDATQLDQRENIHYGFSKKQ